MSRLDLWIEDATREGLRDLLDVLLLAQDPREAMAARRSHLLGWAAAGNSLALQAALLAHPPKAPLRGHTPLMLAASNGDLGMVEMLLPHYSANIQTADGVNALMCAARRGRVACVKRLLPLSDPRAATAEGDTALMIAAFHRQFECASLLLAHSDAKAVNEKGLNALMLAVGLPLEVAEEMPRPFSFQPPPAGAPRPELPAARRAFLEALLPLSDPGALSRAKETALMVAAGSGNHEAVRLLLPHSDARLAAQNGETALTLAAWARSLDSVRALLPRSDANAQNGLRETALIVAAGLGETELVRILAPFSDASIWDEDGLTAFQKASEGWHWQTADFLAALSPRQWVDVIYVQQQTQGFAAERFPEWTARLEREAIQETLRISESAAGRLSENATTTKPRPPRAL